MDFYSSRRNMNAGRFRGNASAAPEDPVKPASLKSETDRESETVEASSCSPGQMKQPSGCGVCSSNPFPCGCQPGSGSQPGVGPQPGVCCQPQCGNRQMCSPHMKPDCGSGMRPEHGPGMMPGYGPSGRPGQGAGMVCPPSCPKCTDTSPGPLEKNYPVAMAFVPWQQWQKLYCIEEGFCKGTIFPDLYLPFEPRRCRV